MADNVTLNPGTGGAVVASDNIGGVQYQRVKVTYGADGAASDVSAANPLPVSGAVTPANITNKFREAFETLDTTTRWELSKASGDIVIVDGNAVSASYLVVSLDPLAANTVTTLTTIPTFTFPLDIGIGAHMSQRTLGQEFAIELVSDETPLSTPADVAISSVSQATTTLSVTTATAHGLRPGMAIGIRDCLDSRMNYSALVVATTPTPTTFTATAGPAGTIPSVTAGPFTSGFVYQRSRLGFAPNGASMIFENATATNASFYVRSESGDVLPSGTAVGNHSVTIATTASVQAINAALTYAFQPTTEYRLSAQVDGIQFSDTGIDAVTAINNRLRRSQVVPDIAHDYKLRIRATNNKAVTRPVAQIVSAVKTGTTTATITTATAHGLTTADLVNIYGIRDQAASSFPNLTTATAVASVVDATTFTIVIGTASTVTSYGGYVSRVNGGQVQQGAIAQAVQSATVASGVVTLVGSAAWSGLLIGDLVNLVGCRDNTTGATLNSDGAYRVRNISGTTLELEPVGWAGPADYALTNCGGAIIRRTDLRVSFVRVLDYERQRVEIMPRPSGDILNAVPVQVNNSPAVTVSSGTVTTVSTLTGGAAAEDAATTSNPLVIGGVVRTATTPTTLIAGDACRLTFGATGAAVTKPYAVTEAEWNYTGQLTTTTAVAAATAAGASLRRYITGLQAINTGTAVDLIILDGTTERWRLTLPQNVPVDFTFVNALTVTANTALNFNLSAAGTVRVNAQGYTAP